MLSLIRYRVILRDDLLWDGRVETKSKAIFHAARMQRSPVLRLRAEGAVSAFEFGNVRDRVCCCCCVRSTRRKH